MAIDSLHQNDNSPDTQGSLLPEPVEENLGHGLVTIIQRLQIRAHAERQRHIDRWEQRQLSCPQKKDHQTHPSQERQLSQWP